jgi:hypothetical protein
MTNYNLSVYELKIHIQYTKLIIKETLNMNKRVKIRTYQKKKESVSVKSAKKT